ncbi:sulfatase-like hydrolase/transferase [Cellvibrio japonicus]|uniref:Putative membrane protein n=1 Tax=Cellvibrio japonicus (strain Ueda107) TaxID=498211 RepID=B3PI62_CELJU|nr:sulfatase-like hydrolase/transferase [Cellvibrio japonicus]ACE84178.1 putative membrane protein [Cellvibrio japonicus Ueda107]QEI11110.1 sulfatase-like hydrolase/transferase [Cellvibrio japonicus]QEI14684.1 sulfatase-like hydrolase/transferase [Cellvibrio japonicus]QEI18264.1 sulfatase-like hydrolase/transferase [Cellvibrio japonicus]
MERKYLIAHGYFTLWVLLLSLAPLLSFWWVMPRPDHLMGEIYRFTTLGYYGLLLSVIAVLCLPLSTSRWTRPLYAILLAGWLLYLVIDVATFNLYLFHVDWVMIEMFLMDFTGLGVPVFLLVLAGLLALATCAVLCWLSAKTPSMAFAQRGKPLLLAVGLFIVLLTGNSIINIWADRYHRQEISYITPYLPLYQPITSSKHAEPLARLLPGIFPAEFGTLDREAVQEKSVIQYPLEPLQCTPPEKPASILMLVVESWQADALNPEVMPNLSRFSEQALRFDRHISGGSATVPGLFSLFFGLHASYYPAFKATPDANPSLFTETLANLGYDTRVYTNTNLERFSLRRLIFPRVPENHFSQQETDRRVVNDFLKRNTKVNRTPQFDFVFLTSSHSPYKYPRQFAYFHPLPKVKGGYALNKHSDNRVYKNDYYNSLVYVDHLLGEILQQLEQTGALENTWVVITGDHAEEFNENQAGFWGHGSNFTRWQTQTPLLVRAPGKVLPAHEPRPSTHQDIVPTLMHEVLGCTTARESYSTGENLLALPEHRNSVISSYYNHAYWVDGTILDRSTGKEYQWNDFNQRANSIDKDRLHQLRAEERRFFKSKASLRE